MIVDMILTVAVVALALGAVAEFQLRICHIGASADRAAVGVGGFRRGGGGFVGACVKMDDLCLGLFGLLAEQAAGIGTPRHGNHVQHVLAEKEKIVGKGDYGEQIVGETVGKQTEQHQCQIDQRENPRFHGDDEEKQEIRVGVQRGVAEKQAQVQVSDAGLTAENQAVNVHHYHTGEVEQVEPQGAPHIFHGSAQGVVAQQGDGGEQNVPGAVGQRVSDQPPDLTLKNGLPIEAERTVQKHAAGHLAEQVDHGGADDDVKHQIGDALIPVFEAEKLKFFA